MPERCKCGSPHIEQYQDNLKRTVRKFECGAVWLEPGVNQAFEIHECSKVRAALEAIKQWTETRR